MSSNSPLMPTFHGHIQTTVDALVLFEACLSGQLNHVPRRPHDRERNDLIKSGHVFIYEEHASGIKRWTDGVSWSPSRILGNFLIYRELEKPFPPGEKKRALKKGRKVPPQGVVKNEGGSKPLASIPTNMDPNAAGNGQDRALIGSLIDSYPFKPDGLVKKTISINFQGVAHHLVSYYSYEDASGGGLVTPTRHATLRNIIPRPELLMSQNFRTPVEENEHLDERMAQGFYMDHEYPHQGGAALLPRTLSLPSQYQAYHPPPHTHTYTAQAANYGFAPAVPSVLPSHHHPQHHPQQSPQQPPQHHHTPLPPPGQGFPQPLSPNPSSATYAGAPPPPSAPPSAFSPTQAAYVTAPGPPHGDYTPVPPGSYSFAPSASPTQGTYPGPQNTQTGYSLPQSNYNMEQNGSGFDFYSQ